jgi:hypothetical protein
LEPAFWTAVESLPKHNGTGLELAAWSGSYFSSICSTPCAWPSSSVSITSQNDTFVYHSKIEGFIQFNIFLPVNLCWCLLHLTYSWPYFYTSSQN